MSAGIYYNKKYFANDSDVIERITNQLNAEGRSCKVIQDCSEINGLDVLFVLGGDGTILSVASACAEFSTKIIGINYGHLGFLAEFEPEKAEEAVKLYCSGKYTAIRRDMLKVVCADKTYNALNDVVIQRCTSGNRFSNTVALQAVIDGSVVDNFLSDGIIVSTPTGSTAYSLSAGGSVMTPDLHAFIMTPICAHSLHSRPVVYNDRSVLEILPSDNATPLNLIVDGKIVGEIESGAKIKILKSERSVEFVSGGDKDFFKKLSIKLNIWSK